MLPLKHLQDSRLVCAEVVGLKLEALLQLGNSPQLLVLLVQEGQESLLVLPSLPEVVLVVRASVAFSDALSEEPQALGSQAEKQNCDHEDDHGVEPVAR